jgi:hypothetical protein
MARRKIYLLSFFLIFALFNCVQLSNAEKIHLVPFAITNAELDTVTEAAVDFDTLAPEPSFHTSVPGPRTRFKAPDTVFRDVPEPDGVSQQQVSPAGLIVATQSYRQPYFLSQQYSYLFRLTPF